MCTCRWVQSEETWQLKIFEPLTGKTIFKYLSISQVKEYIEGILIASKMMEPEFRHKALIGKSFGGKLMHV